MGGSTAGVAFRRQAGACAASGQLGRIFGLIEKRKIVGGRAIKRGNSGDPTIEIGAGLGLGARKGGDLMKRAAKITIANTKFAAGPATTMAALRPTG